MELASTPETSVNCYRSMQRHIPEDGHVHLERNSEFTAVIICPVLKKENIKCHHVLALPVLICALTSIKMWYVVITNIGTRNNFMSRLH
jgi:hypothetical protein